MLNLTWFPAQCLAPVELFTPCFYSLYFYSAAPPPPLSAPPPSSQRFSHLLPLLYHLIKTLLNPAAASSASGPQEIPSGIICVFVCKCLPASCSCLWVFIPLSVWIYFISTYLGFGCFCFARTRNVSQQFLRLFRAC